MAFIPVPNGIQLCFMFTTDSQNWQFCLMLRKSAGAPEDTDLQAVAADGSSWWTSFLKGLLNSAVTLREIIATDMTAQGAPQYRLTINETGTKTGGCLPLGTAVVVSHRTAMRGRSYRGRSFLSGIATSDQNTVNTLAGATASGIVTGFGSLRTLLDGHGYDHVVASRQHNGSITTPAVVNEVVSYVVDTLLDSQRRRLQGRGT